MMRNEVPLSLCHRVWWDQIGILEDLMDIKSIERHPGKWQACEDRLWSRRWEKADRLEEAIEKRKAEERARTGIQPETPFKLSFNFMDFSALTTSPPPKIPEWAVKKWLKR